MNESENILKDIQRDMLNLNKEFKNVELELADYTEKIEQLSKRREQIRGQYTGLYNILMKYQPQAVEPVQQTEENTDTCECDGHCECKDVEPEVKEAKELVQQTEEPVKKTEVLSEKDVAKVKDTLNKIDDTPDYLK